jgi:hypothetical protein
MGLLKPQERDQLPDEIALKLSAETFPLRT